MMIMEEIKKVIEDLGIEAFESSMNIAGLAVMSDSGKLIFQTENWDLAEETKNILAVINGDSSLNIGGITFSVSQATSEGIITTNKGGMGHVIIVPFQGGFLLSYAMSQADAEKVINFLKTNVGKLSGKF